MLVQNPMDPDDRQLLLRTHRGHEPSALLLWERHAPRLLAHAGAIVGAAGAEDTVQTVFCRILSLKRRDIRAVADVPAFLATMTRRTAINSLREATRRRRRDQTAAPTSDTPLPASDDALAAAVQGLPRRAREVVVLKHAWGLTFDQIALALGINRNTAASRYRSAIDELRRRLGAARETAPLDSSVSSISSRRPEVAYG